LAGRLDDNKIFIFDVGSDASTPKLVKTIDNFAESTGFVGPHTFYALPGRMLVQALSNKKDHGGATGLVTYNNAGDLVATTPMLSIMAAMVMATTSPSTESEPNAHIKLHRLD